MIRAKCPKCEKYQEDPHLRPTALCDCGVMLEANATLSLVATWEPTPGFGFIMGTSPTWWPTWRMVLAKEASHCGPVLLLGDSQNIQKTYTVPWMMECVNIAEGLKADDSHCLHSGGSAQLYLPDGNKAITIEPCGRPAAPYNQVLPMLIHTRTRLYVTNMQTIWEKTKPQGEDNGEG